MDTGFQGRRDFEVVGILFDQLQFFRRIWDPTEEYFLDSLSICFMYRSIQRNIQFIMREEIQGKKKHFFYLLKLLLEKILLII